jgi:hypothetical protein
MPLLGSVIKHAISLRSRMPVIFKVSGATSYPGKGTEKTSEKGC